MKETDSNKVLGCVVIFLILKIQRVEPFKQRVVDSKVDVGPLSDGIG